MSLKKTNYLRITLLIAITFIIGVASADHLRTVFNLSSWPRLGDSHTIDQYFRSHPVRKLQLGAGGNDSTGWLNTDIEPSKNEVYLDATSRYPFPDGSIHYVFSEHMIEHVSWEGGIRMLRECYRILATGGKIRIITPNLGKFIQLLNNNLDADAQQFIAAKFRFERGPSVPIPGAYILNREFREYGHQFLYDPPTLRKSLELAGFTQITLYNGTESADPVFREAELRMHHPVADVRLINKWEAMAFEAVR